MRAVSLWQPWASLVVMGIKRYETRSWTHRGMTGPIAIHAARRWGPEQREYCAIPEIAAALRDVGVTDPWTLPRGAIVGEAVIAGYHRTERIRDQLDALELLFGDYSDDRWAWCLTDPLQYRQPIPCLGRQGIFSWTPAGPAEPRQLGLFASKASQ